MATPDEAVRTGGQAIADQAREVKYPRSRMRVALVGLAIAGVETQFKNVSAGVSRLQLADGIQVTIQPYREGDWIRNLSFLPPSTKSSLRQTLCTAPLFRRHRFDAVWSQAAFPLMPWLFTANLVHPLPIIHSMDSTPRQLSAFNEHYQFWGGRSRLKSRLRDLLYTTFLKRTALVNPWTQWAARSFEQDYGVCPERIRILPPGVDTTFWRPPRSKSSRVTPRAIFVGGDFVRKGGDVLLDVFRKRFRGRLELDLVTRAGVRSEPGVRVHRTLSPNDTDLLELYQEADFFVLPTRADCFPMAGLEAMATGLPVIICPVGGIGEMFENGRQGCHVQPEDGRALGEAMEAFVSNSALCEAMGSEARSLALSRYDCDVNTAQLLAFFDEVSKP